MPVSYRESYSTGPITTKIAMLGDRYHEVIEASSGWNESGIPLVGRVNTRWEPVPCGDDIGLFYIVPLLARKTGWSADVSLNVFLLGFILIAAVTGLVGLWLSASRAWQRLLSLYPILAGSYLSYKMGDVYVVQASLVLMLIPWFIYGLRPQLTFKRRVLIVFLAGTTLGIGQWIRTQSASAPLVFFAVLLYFSPLRRSLQFLLSLTLLLGLSLPLLYAQLPLHERDKFLRLNQPGYQPPLNHHLIWHTTYLGLAYLTNPYVSAWRDSVAVEYVESVNPAAIYGGDEYESLLRSRVQQIVQQDHRFIFYTIAAKAGVLACILLVCINIGLPAAISSPKSLDMELAFWLAMAAAALPGMIAIPWPQYVVGMMTLALYYWYYSISFYIESGRQPYLWAEATRGFIERISTRSGFPGSRSNRL